MIVFVPAYDPATRLNLVIARHILTEGCHALLGAEATRAALLKALDHEAQWAVLAMSHGEKEQLLAQGLRTSEEIEDLAAMPEDRQRLIDESRVIALSSGDAARVGRRTLFVYACHTGSYLGKVLAAGGAAYWGYTGKINTPAENPKLLFLFVPIFEYIRDAWHGARTAGERQEVLGQLADLCEKAAGALDDLALDDPELDVLSAALCLLHIWDRIRVWTGESTSPEQHPMAQPPVLLM